MGIAVRSNGDNTYTVTVNNLYHVHTTVTADPDEVSRWIDYVYSLHGLECPIVGLDVEWRPAFGPFINPVAVIQLCVAGRCLVFQILQARGCVPESLSYFLSDARYSFIGVGIREDVQKLRNHYGLHVTTTIDLGTWAAGAFGRAELRQAGLKALANAVIGIDVEKPQRVRLGLWDNPVLSLEQIAYASVDAFLSFEIGRIISDNQGFGVTGSFP